MLEESLKKSRSEDLKAFSAYWIIELRFQHVSLVANEMSLD